MLQREESRHDFAFMAGVIVGAISGALATLALTPMSGADTREKVRQSTSNVDLGPMRERVSTVASSAATTAQSAVATGREKATGLASKSPLPLGRRHSDEADAGNIHTFGRRGDVGTETGSGTETVTKSSGVSGSGSGSTSGQEPRTGFGPHGGHTQEPAEGSSAIGTPGAETSSTTRQSASPSSDAPRSGFGPHGAHTQQPAEGAPAVPDEKPRTGGS